MNKIFILALHTFKELIRKKDFYVLLFLFVALIIFFYNAAFFGIEDITRYLKDIGFSLISLFSIIIAISFSAKQIPSEIEFQTIYPILAKPISRTHLILGKFLGSLFISIIAFTVFYILYLSVIFSKGEGASLLLIIQSYILSILLLGFLSSFAVLFSLFFTVPANITIVFILYFFVYWYNGILRDLLTFSSQKISYLYNILYYILPHFEFYDTRIRLVHMWDPFPLWVITAISIYTILYISLIIWIASAAFRRKSL